jgi:hypothetical protein
VWRQLPMVSDSCQRCIETILRKLVIRLGIHHDEDDIDDDIVM